ncbi:hypothetical protein HG535_0D02460 [Zygotorulaspora mrakii]|uniref:peptide chain release factor N(5)-glutamine methyltransferase n=1 Tax=Zygotorulaspora mrakii TaxID=42260 RepID=A0A7H9B1L8_ZYGMR|nr:uncharacterized protein HG535_0D02460 [Zygotorulaspora mrakii]QLG72538.1 hypothetical protein HG535_0D02460 [Zygotorulaspora mrakii]
MPRISPSSVRACNRVNRFLRLLLPACRTVERSNLEFKWISNELSSLEHLNTNRKLREAIYNACLQRFRYLPLQYILGSQPFGSLELVCRKGVLIPRWETEEWSYELAHRIRKNATNNKQKMVIWDLCSGSGCIALLLKQELQAFKDVNITALDISQKAISLIKRNMARNGIKDVSVISADVLHNPPNPGSMIDILVCNPPYISEDSFVKETSRSVKIHEPRLALVGDKEFYQNLIEHWLPKINSFVYEIGDINQADFVHNAIINDTELNTVWSTGVKRDANGNPRVLYGFRKNGKNNTSFKYHELFDNFGKLN